MVCFVLKGLVRVMFVGIVVECARKGRGRREQGRKDRNGEENASRGEVVLWTRCGRLRGG